MNHKPASSSAATPGTSKSGFALSLKGRALRLLSGREQSRGELERKLRAHEEVSGQLAAVLDELEAKDFISPTRVIESVINSISVTPLRLSSCSARTQKGHTAVEYIKTLAMTSETLFGG